MAGSWRSLPGQPDLLGQAKVPRKATKPVVCLTRRREPCDAFPHEPSSCDSCKRMSTQSVLLVPRLVGNAGALLQKGVGDLDVNVLLFVARFGARAARGR